MGRIYRKRAEYGFGEYGQESPRQTKPKKGPKRKVHEFRPFLWEFWCFSLGKQARFTLNFCSGMPLRKVHELTFLWFGLSGPLLIRFQTPNSVSFFALTEFRGANSVSSSQPIIFCVPKQTHRVFRRTHRVCRRTQWVLSSETVLSKQYSARFLRNYIRPPPPLPPFLAKRHLSGEGGWGVYFEAPQEFYTPPFYTPPTPSSIFRGWGGVGCIKFGPVWNGKRRSVT